MEVVTEAVKELPLMERSAWKALNTHSKKIGKLHLRDLFATDPERGRRLAVEAAGLYLDYSKNRVTDDTLNLLLQLAEESGLRARIEAMFRGEKINRTEKRAVLHVALRAPQGASIVVEGRNVVPDPRRASKNDGLLEPRPQWRVDWAHRKTHPQHHQYRDWWLGSGTRHGL